MIEVCNVSYQIGRRVLVNDVSLRVEPGKVAALLGPNGAGKSTLLKIMAGERPPSSGSVRIDGRALTEIRPSLLALRRAVVSQSGVVSFDFTAREIVKMGRLPHGDDPATEDRIVALAMRSTDCFHLAGQAAGTLSGGELQRVHAARALAQIWGPPAEGARYLFLDEPTASLDLCHQHGILALAREFAGKNGAGVFVVLHDLNLAARYADWVGVMKQGELVAGGEPEKVLTADLVRDVFATEAVISRHPMHGSVCVLA